MKKLLLLAGILSMSMAISFAQKKFTEGKIVYEISYPNSQYDAQTMAMLPKEVTMLVKNDKSRTEQKMAMGMNSVTISDAKAKTAVSLMDMMGNKTAIKMTAADMEKQAPKAPTVNITKETKDIAGYKCTKAEIIDDKGNKSYVYFTKDIKANPAKNQFKGIDGFPMEYEISQQGMTMKMTVTSVNQEPVSDSNFSIPEGYKEMTMEEFQKSMGGLK